MTEHELNRYNRHIRLPEIGLAGQQKLKAARVAVIGAGGLGCPVLQYLTAAGVGTIGIIDGDVVEESNLQRQILFSTKHIGQPKADAAVSVLAQQNPYLTLRAHSTFLEATNALSLLERYDIVVDGSDNFATRYLVNDACVTLRKPLVFGSIHKFEGQVSVFNVQNGPTYRCLYPEPSELADCANVGVLGVLPGITGCLMANEVIKLITGIGDVLAGKLLVFDALSMAFNTFSVSANPVNEQIWNLAQPESGCDTLPEITASTLMTWLQRPDKPLLVDVREPHEYDREHMGGILIPLAELLRHPQQLSPDQTIVIHCQSGSRSRKAVAFLRNHGYQQVYNLQGGLNSVQGIFSRKLIP